MKNFLELTDIRSQLTLDFELTLTPVGSVEASVDVNGELWQGNISVDPSVIKRAFPLSDPIFLKITIPGREHPNAIKVGLVIDGKEVLPTYQGLANPATDYIDTDDPWTLDIPNFYPWYHEITGQGFIA